MLLPQRGGPQRRLSPISLLYFTLCFSYLIPPLLHADLFCPLTSLRELPECEAVANPSDPSVFPCPKRWCLEVCISDRIKVYGNAKGHYPNHHTARGLETERDVKAQAGSSNLAWAIPPEGVRTSRMGGRMRADVSEQHGEALAGLEEQRGGMWCGEGRWGEERLHRGTAVRIWGLLPEQQSLNLSPFASH